MKRMESEGIKKGRAVVKVSEDGGRFQVVFEDGTKFVVNKADCPDVMQKGNWFVDMNSEGGVMNLRPYGVICKAKFSRFVADETNIPAPKLYNPKNPNYSSYLAFTSLLNLGGDYKGMVQPHFTAYKFGEYEGTAVILGSGAWADKLQATLEAYGVMDQDIPFEDNLLPTLQKMILVEDRVFSLTLNKDGFVDSIMELPNQSTPEDDFSLASSEPEEGEDDDFSDDEEGEDIPF